MYVRITEALEAAGLSNNSDLNYLDKFKERKLPDSNVDTCLKHKSLKPTLEKIIPVPEHYYKFVYAFRNPGIPIPAYVNFDDSTQPSTSTPGQNCPNPCSVDELPLLSNDPDPFSTISNFVKEGLTRGSGLDFKGFASTGCESPRIQLQTEKSTISSNQPRSLPTIITASPLPIPIPILTKAVTQSSKKPVPPPRPRKLYRGIENNGRIDIRKPNELRKQSGAPESEDDESLPKPEQRPPTTKIKTSSNTVTVATNTDLNIDLEPEPEPEPDLRKNPDLLTTKIILLEQSATAYREGIKLLQAERDKPFALQSELENAHQLAQQWALESLVKNVNSHNNDNRTNAKEIKFEEIKNELTQRTADSFRLTCIENTQKLHTSVKDAILKLELYFTSIMKEKITRHCTGLDDNFVEEATFDIIFEESQVSSMNFAGELLKIGFDFNFEAFPAVQQEFQKTLSSLKERMELQNKIRILQAQIRLRQEVQELSFRYKSQMLKIIQDFKFWTGDQLKKKEDFVRGGITRNFNSLYSSSSLFSQGTALLLESTGEAAKDIHTIVQMQNEKYLMSCTHLVSELAKNYAQKIKEHHGGGSRSLSRSRSRTGTGSYSNNNSRSSDLTHSEIQQKCLSVLKNSMDFNRLPPEDSARFILDLSSQIENTLQEEIKSQTVTTAVALASQDSGFNPEVAHYVPPPPPRPPPPSNASTRKPRASEPGQSAAYDSFRYTVHEFKPTPTVGRAGGFYVEESELRSCIKKELLGTSVIDAYASIICEVYQNQTISYLPSTALCFTGNQWRVAHYLDDMISVIKRSSSPSMTTLSTVVTAGWHWMLFVANNHTGEIQIADTLGGFCNAKKLNDGIKLLIDNVLDEVFGRREWNTKYFKGIVKQDDGYSCGPAALYFLEKLYRNFEIKCDNPADYKTYRKRIVERILQTTDAGNTLLQGNTDYTRYLRNNSTC